MASKSEFSISASGAQNWVPVNPLDSAFNVGVNIVKGSAVLTVAIEVTNDNPFTGTPTNISVHTADANGLVSLTTPVVAVRLNATAYTSGTANGTIVFSPYGNC